MNYSLYNEITEDELKALTLEVCQVAREAGRKILDIYEQDFDVMQKRDASPVTTADYASHDVVYERLSMLTPTVPILSEEGVSIPFSERQQWRRLWLIDPLDGTREFIKRNGEFTVNISLVVEHKAVLGVIYAPTTNECYFAYAGGGAYKQNQSGEILQINSRQWDGKHVVVTANRALHTANFKRFLAGFENYDTVMLGSALKSCVVAEGRADLYARFGPTSEWDTAAAQCIVEEAGGSVFSIEGKPLRYNQKASLINPSFLVVGDVWHDWLSYLPSSVS